MDWIRAKGTQLMAGEKPILLTGFGLGGWLLPEGYMWQMMGNVDRPRRMEALIECMCGPDYAASFWKKYNARYITEWDIALISALGYNSVRLPVNTRHLDEGIATLDRMLPWCKRWNIYIILDVHAAPGGQTGANIDDSAHDLPELFLEEKYQQELIDQWRLLARRYRDEAAIAGYDLINEPLPPWQLQYSDRVAPLYFRLRDTIRKEDPRHLLILEGVRWASDVSIFDDFSAGSFDDNWMLQFHRYWSNPDKEGIQCFIDCARRLNVPLFMGEGGENNTDWYTAFFPLLEREGIHWSFWAYKKMNGANSPVSFPRPLGWEKLRAYVEEGATLSVPEAQAIWDEFLDCIACGEIQWPVIHSLQRSAPCSVPAAAYDRGHFLHSRPDGAQLRMNDQAALLFADGHTGEVNFAQMKGEDQPDSEAIFLRLRPGEWAEYAFRGDGTLRLEGKDLQQLKIKCLQGEENQRIVRISCLEKEADLYRVNWE